MPAAGLKPEANRGADDAEEEGAAEDEDAAGAVGGLEGSSLGLGAMRAARPVEGGERPDEAAAFSPAAPETVEPDATLVRSARLGGALLGAAVLGAALLGGALLGGVPPSVVPTRGARTELARLVLVSSREPARESLGAPSLRGEMLSLASAERVACWALVVGGGVGVSAATAAARGCGWSVNVPSELTSIETAASL